jgi:hypothetical protein
MTTSSTSFYIILPSNTNVDGNKTNSFRVRLPHKLQFNSEWSVGLAVLVYPHTWPSLGTNTQQFLNVVWKTGENVRIELPSSTFTNPHELTKAMTKALQSGSEELAKKVRTTQFSFHEVVRKAENRAREEYGKIAKEKLPKKKGPSLVKDIEEVSDLEGAQTVLERQERESSQMEEEEQPTSPENLPTLEELYNHYLNEEIAQLDDEDRSILDQTKQKGLEPWIHAYRHVNFACRLQFDPTHNRFTFHLDSGFIQQVELSEQLSYILGFEGQVLTATTVAKFMPDLKGGVSSFLVYAPGLIEPMMFGDVTAPILRAVTIRGAPDEIVEEQFFAIQYHKLLVKEISEIFIEIRTANGVLMPFMFGNCILTLHFRKASYF